MYSIKERVNNGELLVSDGAWGTFLHEKGLTIEECPEMWNIDHEQEVLEVAQSYVAAGPDMILTNTFGANPSKLAGYGLQDRTYDINKKAAEISRQAAGNTIHVLGSMGPTGKMLMMEEITEEEMYSGYQQQAKALEDGGADAILVETMSDLTEASIAVRAAKENTSLDIIATMTFEKGVDGGYYTMMGVTPSQAVEDLINTGADIVGANCGNGIEEMIGIIEEIRSVNKEVPVLIHANAGIPEYQNGETVFPEGPDEMASYVPQLIHAGANIVGGCCGTTPEHIKRMVETVRDLY